jgi:ketosteroid isomerase-like protein
MKAQAIDEIAGRLEKAFNAKDAAALTSLYSETATLMPPNQSAVKGRAAIQAWFQTALPRVGTVRIAPTRSIICENDAFQVGAFTSIGSADRSAAPNNFKYVLILKRVGPHWQIEYDIWNSDSLS